MACTLAERFLLVLLSFYTFPFTCVLAMRQHAEDDQASLLQLGTHKGNGGKRGHLVKGAKDFAALQGQTIEGVSLFQVDSELSSTSDKKYAASTIVVTDAAELHHFIIFGSVLFALLLILFSCVTIKTILLPIVRRKATPSTIRTCLKQLKLTRGAELEAIFRSRKSKASPSPAQLMRLQGKVMSVTQHTLVGPFSGEPCVVCAASVSQQRLDGINPPPIAYQSTFTDFVIELLDEPKLQLKVCGSDAALFDMVVGNLCSRHSFATAPDSWRTFALGHLSSNRATTSLVQGCIDGCGDLTFQEASLFVGATVSCVGEVARDMKGDLTLVPWIPPDFDDSLLGGSARKFHALNPPTWWRTPWGAFKASQHEAFKEVFVGRVMISDDPALLEGKFK